MYQLFLSDSWGAFLVKVAKAPQRYVMWLIVFLVVLFFLSRLRNIMEERGVNRAIYVSRAFVGTFIAFVVTPIVFYLLLNVIALVHGVNTIDIGFLAKWLGLTVSSYWWLLRCAFNAADLVDANQIYSLDSIIRIAWILLPFSIIWLRTSSSRVGKLFLIPLIIGTFVITRYKYAPPTFLTQDEAIMERIPGMEWLNSKSSSIGAPSASMLKANQRKIVALVLALLILLGFALGLGAKKRVAGLLLVAIGIMGFLLIAPHESARIVPEEHQEHYNADLQVLIHQLDSVYRISQNSIEAYEISMKISSAYQARMAVGDVIRFPDSLCRRYHDYFYDWCKY